MKVAIIGSGVYALAISKILLQNKCEITMWTEQKDTSKIVVPKEIKITNDYQEAIDEAQLIYILTSSKFCENIFKNIKPLIKKDQIIILGSKGILDNGTLLPELLKTYMPDTKYAVISGPTFAVDIASLEPIGFTIGTEEKQTFNLISKAMQTIYLEYVPETHVVSLAGSLKNAYAIGSGMLEGFNYGPSTRCLYITKVLKEISFIFKQFNLDEQSIISLAGAGDLILTCTSLNSRNFTFGTMLSLETKEEKKEYLKTNTVEGYENLKVFADMFRQKNVKAPILFCVFDIVVNDVPPRKLIELLLQ